MRRRTVLAAGAAAAVGASATAAMQSAPASANPPGTDVVISEVQSRAANVDNEIANAAELFNPDDTPRNISGWEIRFYDASNTPTASLTFPSGTEVPARGFILVTDPGYLPLPAPPNVLIPGVTLFTYNLAFGASDGLPDAGGVALFDSSAVRVDGVATDAGVTDALEGNPVAPLDSGTDMCCASIQRDCLATDTDNNAVDFSRRRASWGDLC